MGEWFEGTLVFPSVDATAVGIADKLAQEKAHHLAALQNNQRLGERFPSLAALEARESTELVKLREENARLKANQLIDASTVSKEQWDEMMARRDEVRLENQRLRMQLADSQGCYDDVNARLSEAQVELELCKHEIARLDPRLHAARWGRR